MAKEQKRVYEVTINTAEGTCKTSVFEKMARKGDITSVSVKDMVDEEVKIKGYANCHIVTSEKEFDVLYMDTNKGFIHTGSKVFIDAMTDYYPEIDMFRIASVKTKNGTAYKAVPVLFTYEPEAEQSEDDELPFK